MPSYLVTGSKGQLGMCFHSIQSEFPQYQLLFASQSKVDITQAQTLSNFLKNNPFEGIINCAAYTQVDQAEIDSDKANKINSEGIQILIQIAEANNLKLIHFSSLRNSKPMLSSVFQIISDFQYHVLTFPTHAQIPNLYYL